MIIIARIRRAADEQIFDFYHEKSDVRGNRNAVSQ